MGIFIEKLIEIDVGVDRHEAVVRHEGNRITALVAGPIDRIKELLGASLTAEYELTTIHSVVVNLPKNDEASGIFPHSSNSLVIDGTVHNLIQANEDITIIDVYIQNGADFIAITSDDVPSLPSIHSRIQIRGRGLVVYPTFA